jgi:hypothetical protein
MEDSLTAVPSLLLILYPIRYINVHSAHHCTKNSNDFCDTSVAKVEILRKAQPPVLMEETPEGAMDRTDRTVVAVRAKEEVEGIQLWSVAQQTMTEYMTHTQHLTYPNVTPTPIYGLTTYSKRANWVKNIVNARMQPN